jgi:hypothetical protein
LLLDAHLATGMALFHQGEFARARDHLERGVALYRPESDGPHLTTHGQDPGVFCLSYWPTRSGFSGIRIRPARRPSRPWRSRAARPTRSAMSRR